MPILSYWITRRRPARPLGPPLPACRRDPDVTIRGGDPLRDGAAVARLAAMDDAPVPAAPWLVAAAGGELRAALSLRDRAGVADPFWPSAPLAELLRERAAQLSRPPAARPGGGLRRGVVRLGGWAERPPSPLPSRRVDS